MKTNFRLIAKTLFGLEEVLAAEISKIGGRNIRTMVRSVEFDADERMLYRANLWCRTATRILMPISTFKVMGDKDLYRGVSRIDWLTYLKPGSTLAVDPMVSHSVFNNSQYVAQKTKDAIVDQIRRKTGKRPSVDLKNPDLRINLHIHEDKATLSLDSSGEPLHRRGYRIVGGPAPLNESLAAGIIYLTGWNGASCLIDPMCGSGTFIIEAALMARNIAPGLIRKDFGFLRWHSFSEELFQKEVKLAKKKINPPSGIIMAGFDISKKSIEVARENASRAGIGDDVSFAKMEMANVKPSFESGVVILNPPYGERLSIEDTNSLYAMIGDTLKQRFDGFEAFIFTGNMGAIKKIGLRASLRIKLYNGPIECRLLKYQLYRGSKKKKYSEE